MATWIGPKEVAFLLAQAPELPAPPANWEALARQRVFYDPTSGGDLRSYIRTVSYGKARLLGDVYGPFAVNAQQPNGGWDIGNAMDQAITAATAGGQLGGVTNFCVIFTDHPGPSWAFWGSGGGRCYVDMITPLGVFAMENLHVLASFGDLYGLSDSPGGFDVMDCACGTHPSSYTKLNFGWLDPAEVATVTPSSGASPLTLHALSSPLASAPAPGRVHAARLPAPTGPQYYLMEARLRTDRYESVTPGVSSGLPAEGVVVYWIDESVWPPVHLRATLSTPGATYTDQANGVGITLTGTVQDGFTVTVDRSEPADCTTIRDELASLEAEIGDLQAELQDAPPGQKPQIVRAIRRLQAQARTLQERGEQMGCTL